MKRGRYSAGGAHWNCAEKESIDDLYRRLVGQDDGFMPLPPIGGDPHLLTTKIRKQYFDAVIKLLCVNYENSQKLLGKNLRLPSAIWRCAKYIEMQAVQACMLMQLYRENILEVIKQLKVDTEKGKLHKQLFECLLQPASNDKGTQVNLENKSSLMIKKRKRNCPPSEADMDKIYDSIETKVDTNGALYKIPGLVNVQTAQPSSLAPTHPVKVNGTTTDYITKSQSSHVPIVVSETPMMTTNIPNDSQRTIDNLSQPQTNLSQPQTTPVETNHRLSIESTEDQVMLQMEKLFQTDENEDDIFEGTFSNNFDFFSDVSDKKTDFPVTVGKQTEEYVESQTTPIPIQSLDERIALLKSTGVLAPPIVLKAVESPKTKKACVSKWICELYFQRLKLSETMDQIIENNRRKHERIKQKFIELFGEDEDEYLIMSPVEETPDFILSCNERIAPFVVKHLMKYYNNGRIKSKQLFKGIAKHVMDKIISCHRFPDEYEVFNFITDYFKVRSVIRCKADFYF